MKISKRKFLLSFLAITLLLALIRIIFPSVAGKKYSDDMNTPPAIPADTTEDAPAAEDTIRKADSALRDGWRTPIAFFDSLGQPAHNRVKGVLSFRDNFPDSNSVQLLSAQRYGVKPVADQRDAEHRKRELVYIGSNPYYDVDRLRSSIPYLVPEAALLLQDIARNFFDSLQVKRLPLNKLLITSVLRSKADVEALRQHNGNATQNSCHLYGTTFDISYNRFHPLYRKVGGDTLKLVLCEVLNDLRLQGRCYAKYERHQGCLHVTVR